MRERKDHEPRFSLPVMNKNLSESPFGYYSISWKSTAECISSERVRGKKTRNGLLNQDPSSSHHRQYAMVLLLSTTMLR